MLDQHDHFAWLAEEVNAKIDAFSASSIGPGDNPYD
jgi:hypothetical protein